MVGTRNAAFAEESAEVEVLLASLGKTKDITKRIAASMARLDASGEVVRDAIGPINSNTQSLQITSRNIERINEAIEKLRAPLDARGREESIIRQGPKSAGLPQYIGALRRVDKALADLNSSGMRSNQQAITEFTSLLSTGVEQLNDAYRDVLQGESQTLEPLHYITKQIPFPTISQDKIQLLGQMAAAIASAGSTAARVGQREDDAAARIYAEVRGAYLQGSLQNMATATVNTSKRRTDDAAPYRAGSNGVGPYASSIEGMFLAEAENASKIFRNEAGRVFPMTCAKAINTLFRTLSDLNIIVKSRLLADCFLAYEVIDVIGPVAMRIDQRTKQLRHEFADAVRPLRDTARNSLPELIQQTKRQAESVSTLPPDGNTIPLVSQTASRLQSLATCDRPILVLLASLGDGNWKSSSANGASTTSLTLELTPSSENPTLMSHYLLDLVAGLIDTLQSRSATLHRTKPLQAIFLLNSVAVLTRAINSSPDLARYLGISPHNAKLDGYRKSASSLYLAAWREPSTHLLDTIHTSSRPMSGQTGAIDSSSIIKSLSSKDKDKIKEKFKAFNTSFDELVARHKGLFMEKEVRTMLAREIQAMIEPLYARFWDRYHEVDKGKGKVVRYGKSELAGVMSGL